MISIAPPPPVSLSPADRPPPQIRGDQNDELDADILKRSVLVIEDEAMIAWTLESLLHDMGFEHIAIAASGAEALDQASSTKPGLILSDINLGAGEMDGIAAVAAIVDVNISVVFITAYVSPDSRQRIYRDVPGAVVLRKPVDASTLRRAIVDVTSSGQLH